MDIFRTHWNSALFLTKSRQVIKTDWRNNLLSEAFSLKVNIRNMQNLTTIKSDVVTWLKMYNSKNTSGLLISWSKVKWQTVNRFQQVAILRENTLYGYCWQIQSCNVPYWWNDDPRDYMIALPSWSRLTDKVRRVMTEKKPTKKSSLVALQHKAIFHMQARMCSKTGDWMKNRPLH